MVNSDLMMKNKSNYEGSVDSKCRRLRRTKSVF